MVFAKIELNPTLSVTAIAAGALIIGGCGDDQVTNGAEPCFKTQPTIEFSVQPSDVVVNQVITPPIELRLLDPADCSSTRTGAPVQVFLTLSADPSGGRVQLAGTLNKASEDGIAVFDDINLDFTGAGYRIQALANDTLSSAIISERFEVLPAP